MGGVLISSQWFSSQLKYLTWNGNAKTTKNNSHLESNIKTIQINLLIVKDLNVLISASVHINSKGVIIIKINNKPVDIL